MLHSTSLINPVAKENMDNFCYKCDVIRKETIHATANRHLTQSMMCILGIVCDMAKGINQANAMPNSKISKPVALADVKLCLLIASGRQIVSQ